MTGRETVQQAYDAFGRGDIPGVLALMSPEVQWGSAPTMPFGSQVGPQAVAQNVFAALPTVLDGFRLDITEVLEAEDAVIGRGVYRGTGRQTGQQLSADFVHVWRFDDDGRIVFFQTYTDTHAWRTVLGMDEDAAGSSQAARSPAVGATSGSTSARGSAP